MTDWILLIVGLAALFAGAEGLVRGASRLASALGVRPIVIGLTVVGFGTSMPEVVVSALAAWQGQTEVALGNVLGSNIANTGLILALAVLLRPAKTDLALLEREGPLMVAVTLGVWGLAWSGGYARWMGAALLAALAGFVAAALAWSRQEKPEVEAEFERFERERKLIARGTLGGDCAWIAGGLAALVAGGHLLVSSAVTIAGRLGVPEAVIAVTLVAVGTSLPELATSLVAAARNEPDIAVGNIVGSNIFNLLGVLGVSAVVRPIPVGAGVRDFEMLWMLGLGVATALVLRTGHRVTRAEGALLLAAYAAFIVLLLG